MKDKCKWCDKDILYKGLCSIHYYRDYRRSYQPPDRGLCKYTDCIKPARTQGWCSAHYERYRKHGDPSIKVASIRHDFRDMPVEERFWSKVEKLGPDDCWEWLGGTRKGGYGSFWKDGKTKVASRVSYEFVSGSIPDGMHCCHTCDNPPCVNPAHLFIGTSLTNVRDKMTKGRGAGNQWRQN